MKTSLAPEYANSASGREVEAILRSCVHCGFCMATCPTYLETRDERDGPRGRIYLVRQFFEGADVSERTRFHLDRCLGCRNCETTCPSAVRFARLLDLARGEMERKVPRKAAERMQRLLLRRFLSSPGLFAGLLAAGRLIRPLAPGALKKRIPPRQGKERQQTPPSGPKPGNRRRMILLHGCVQPSATPNTNAAAGRVLDRLGISLVVAPGAGCCGAVSYHLGAHKEGLELMRRNIDAWWPLLEDGAEAIVTTASGCGALVRDYGDLLKDDAKYGKKARRISELARDLGEIVAGEDLDRLDITAHGDKVSLHVPCTLQHAQGWPDGLAEILRRVGFRLAATRESHLCCGSGGTYSILQPEMSRRLLTRKLEALQEDDPALVVTANIGCQLHLQSGTDRPVKHWIELLDENMS